MLDVEAWVPQKWAGLRTQGEADPCVVALIVRPWGGMTG